MGAPASPHAASLEDRVRQAIGASQFSRYFQGQTRLNLSEDGLVVRASSDILARLIERRFARPLVEAALAARVQVRVDRDIQTPARAAAPVSRLATPIVRPAAAPTSHSTVGRFRLDDFVVGTTNRLAHAASVRFADGDEAASCLFIHGPCGVGKTHLLQGIAARHLQRNPHATVRYTTAEAFTNDYIAAVRSGRLDAFRKIYRKLDLLCLDDVHFVAAKEGTQGELLHTFDAIGQSGSRVVLASDEHPRAIAKFHEKLVSRIMAGAVVRIDLPDADLRERLVRALATRRGLSLEDAAIKLVASHASALTGGSPSVRDLDGVLIQIEAVHRLLPEFATGGMVGVLAVRKALGLVDGAGGPRPRRALTIEAIYLEVCRCMGVDPVELMGKGRHKRVVLARAACVHLCRQHTTHSYPEIAKGIGRPNHSTVITAHQRLSGQLETIGSNPPEPEVTIGLLQELKGLTLRQLIDAIDERVRRLNTTR